MYLFKNRLVTKWQNVSLGRQQSFFKFRGENPPSGALIRFYLKSKPTGQVEIKIEDLLGKQTRVLTASGKPGINQVRWDMRFPVSGEEQMVFQNRLAQILEKLSQLVKKPEEKRQIEDLKTQFNEAKTYQKLNAIYRQLTRNFSSYSEGQDLFGPRMRDREAEAGEYRVTLTVDGKSMIGKLQIRPDPLLK